MEKGNPRGSGGTSKGVGTGRWVVPEDAPASPQGCRLSAEVRVLGPGLPLLL